MGIQKSRFSSQLCFQTLQMEEFAHPFSCLNVSLSHLKAACNHKIIYNHFFPWFTAREGSLVDQHKFITRLSDKQT